MALLALQIFALASLMHAQKLVLIDQDGSGPGGSNQMAMLVLLQSTQVRVLGITMVSGNAWQPEETQHTLRMLELTGHRDVPVVPGATFPLKRNRREAALWQKRHGKVAWSGAWGDLAQGTGEGPYHAPFSIPRLAEGKPGLKAHTAESAPRFLIRNVREHPHQVLLYAAGPLTNVARAIQLDPEFASLTAGIVIMGSSIHPETKDPEFARTPRHEFNFWFDPEAAHITLTAAFPRIDITTTDVSLKTYFTEKMLAEISTSSRATAQYISKYSEKRYYLWDELAAATILDPSLITREEILYMDVSLDHGPTYGDTLTWAEENKPAGRSDLRKVHAQMDVDLPRFEKLFVDLMKR